ncbi:MAG: DUF2227 family putative metal-binding protein [Chlamydiae bacterium]|nr:DUF2227 family putative metal-binding protein [Chlamydiota bacterium]
MALYKTHAKFNIFFALPLILFGANKYLDITFNNLAFFSFSFTYATLFMNPDLDMASQIKLFSLKGLLTIPFRLYSMIFKHRGLSHMPIIGSITRILWLFGFFYVLGILIDLPSTKIDFYKILQKEAFIYIFSGIVLADGCHLLLDIKRA